MTNEQSILLQSGGGVVDPSSLVNRVFEFEKNAKSMIEKLNLTCEKIKLGTDGLDAVEHLKLSIAPDAASLISQGDTLVLETHGKSTNLSSKVMQIQAQLRDKFREMKFGRKPQSKDVSKNINECTTIEKEITDKQLISDYLTSNEYNIEKMLQNNETEKQFTAVQLQNLLADIQVKI